MQRLELEDGSQVEGWGKPGEGNRRMWPSRKNVKSCGPVLKTPKTEYTFSWCVFVHPHKTVYAHGCVELGDRPDFGFSFFLTTKGRHLSPVEIGNEGSPGRY